MTRKLMQAAAAATMGLLLALPAQPADKDDPALSRDLTSTIALLGQPCGKVVKSERRGTNDYVATCQDGNRYHVTVNAKGKVVAKKL